MAIGAVEQADAVVDSAGLQVFSTIVDAAQAGVGDGAGTHGAGLERHIEVAAIEPAGATHGERRPDGEELGMGGGIVQLAHAVAFGGQHAVACNDHGPDRGLTGCGGGFGEGEGLVHRGGHDASLTPKGDDG